VVGYVLRRLGALALTLAGLSMLVFAIARLLPGDPAKLAAGPQASAAEIAARRVSMKPTRAQGTVARMTQLCNNIDIYTQFVARILDFRQRHTNPEGLRRASRVYNACCDRGKAGELNSHWLPGSRPSLAF
jgi:hypothetical protein